MCAIASVSIPNLIKNTFTYTSTYIFEYLVNLVAMTKRDKL